MQRCFDILFSALALLVLSPLLIPLGILLRLTGEGEIFFMQGRIGKEGRSFELYKFATMLKNSPNMGTGTVTVKNDPRILPLGTWMRRTKINELPQLLNILRGDMSIIGPRPQTLRCFGAFTPSVQKAIIQVRPGLSGVGSIIFRDEEGMLDGHEDAPDFYDNVIAPYKGELEEWYVANQGLRTYFTLIFLTAWVVLAPQSRFVWRVLGSLPKPTPRLAQALRPLNGDTELVESGSALVAQQHARAHKSQAAADRPKASFARAGSLAAMATDVSAGPETRRKQETSQSTET